MCKWAECNEGGDFVTGISGDFVEMVCSSCNERYFLNGALEEDGTISCKTCENYLEQQEGEEEETTQEKPSTVGGFDSFFFTHNGDDDDDDGE